MKTTLMIIIISISSGAFAASPQSDTQRKHASKEIKKGPLKDNTYYYNEEGPDGKEARKAAEKNKLDISKKVQNQKQQGY